MRLHLCSWQTAYKDDSAYHKEWRFQEQYLACLRSKEVNCYLAHFCSELADIHELVNQAEAYRATQYEKDCRP